MSCASALRRSRVVQLHPSALTETEKFEMRTLTANKITGANAGGAARLQFRTWWAARIAQFFGSATSRALTYDYLRIPKAAERALLV
jgi:hypothetical protein